MRGRGLRAEAVVIAALVRVALRVLPLSRVIALLDRRRGRRDDVDVPACLAAAASAAARVAHPTCLYRSLVAFALLARRGAPVAFHLGASRAAGFEAHAWISVAGHAADDDDAGWRPVWAHGAAGRAGR